MDGTTEHLRTAREAYEQRDWPRAFDAFAAADDVERDPDDLMAYSNAAWWLGRNDDALRSSEAAYHRFLADGRHLDAAQAALEVAYVHILRGDEPVGFGWVGRAVRLLQDIPEGPLHGQLLYLTEVEAGLGDPDPVPAIAAAQRVQGLGHRFGDPGLVAAGLNGEGRGLLRVGRVEEGMARLDEAMITVLDGELPPDLAGNLYCNTIAACHEVADMRRMAHWTQLMSTWLDTLPAAVLFGGICRVHQAQLLVVQGAWEEAEQRARRVAAELERVSVQNTAEAWYVVAECRRLRGDREGAHAAYGEAHARGRDPQPGLALLLMQAGDVDNAFTAIRSALAAAVGPLARARVCAAVVEIGLSADRIDEARTAADELAATAARYPTSGLEAQAAGARGAVLVAEGRVDEALAVLRDACRRWYDLGSEYDAAGSCLQLARAYTELGDVSSARLELDRATSVFEKLGADTALAGVHGVLSTPAGLTERELEVLALVAAGLSNRAIGDELYISDRTVARHLSNIFRKIGAESRTQASRYAHDHGLVRAAR